MNRGYKESTLLINKRRALIAMLLVGSILPLKQLMVPAGLCVSFIIGRLKKHEIVSFFTVVGVALLPLAISAYRAPVNLATSLFLLFPFIYMLLFRASAVNALRKVDVTRILDFVVYLLIFNGTIGLVQYGLYRHDDAAIGFYGRSSLQGHGLAILYFMAALYVLSKPFRKVNAAKAGMLLIFMISCFYGAGLIAAILALGLSSLLFSNNKIKTFLVSTVILVFLGVLAWLISPGTMKYNYTVLLIFVDGIFNIITTGTADTHGMPRKLTAWTSYFQAIAEAPSNIIAGFGGGTYNSRAAFLLNGDYSSLSFLPVSFTEVHRDYVMPLWSTHILSQAYSDGTMNQPFSSVLALLAEYGVLVFSLVLIGYMSLWKKVLEALPSSRKKIPYLINTLFVFFAFICLFDNILEYPEIVIPFIFFSFGITGSEQERKTHRKEITY